MNKRLMFSAALVMALLSANAQKRAFTIEDLYRVKGLSSVVFPTWQELNFRLSSWM